MPLKPFNIKNNLIMLTRKTFAYGQSHGFEISMLYVVILRKGN